MSDKRKQFKSQMNSSDVCEQTASIFTLNVDCLDKIFDYLSMRDIILFGQTCKAMHLICGEYFRQNYGAVKNYHTDCGTYTKYFDREDVVGRFTETTAFNRFMKKIEFSNSWNYIEWFHDDFTSLNHICFRDFADIYFPKQIDVDLNMNKNQTIKHILNKVKIVEIRNVRIDVNIFENFLKSCSQMTHLYVQHPQLGTIRNDTINLWLLQKYPSLEHMELIPRFYRINELSRFFQVNRNVRSFSTSTACLSANKDELLESNIKLDHLQVKYFYNGSEDNVKSVCHMLNELYERGFYQKLRFNFENDNFNQDINGVEHVFSLFGLEKLYISEFLDGNNLTGLKNVKELVLTNHYNLTDMETVAKHLINLELLDLSNANLQDLLPFIRHSTKLRHLRIGVYSGDLDLKMFNDERSKQFQSRKLFIYVPDNVYLKMKWTKHSGDTYDNFVEIKRTSSYDWEYSS